MAMLRTATGKLLLCLMLAIIVASGCGEPKEPEQTLTREETIPAGAVKMLPETDSYPPILHSGEFHEPVPLQSPINTAGAEDSPFIPEGKEEMYFFFTPDPTIPAEKQLLDGVTGIWLSQWRSGQWQEPERVWLQDEGKLALDGCTFVSGNLMYFCSAREGYAGVHWFTAEFEDGQWQDWANADFPEQFEVGELHIWGDELYYHSSHDGGEGSNDIWMLERVNGEWQEPVNVAAVNTAENEGMPFLTSDGLELWFHRFHQGSPAVFRSRRVNGEWQTPEMIVSQFAGEPTVDWQGNLYFVHHFYKDNKMIEADIYVAYRK